MMKLIPMPAFCHQQIFSNSVEGYEAYVRQDLVTVCEMTWPLVLFHSHQSLNGFVVKRHPRLLVLELSDCLDGNLLRVFSAELMQLKKTICGSVHPCGDPSNALKKQSANRHYKKNDIELFRNTLKARKCWGLCYNIQRGDALLT